ncbi:hypothetical protein [Mesoplasma melaleucae]|uniref:Uncharacterized protein n=1 Tax=Mesoplasma melaleucae TaxID=81459 RepID=A0A2K8NXR9_9MOLU|nr:hypothetical protein [Mesoplasma melaleucae]ATZ17968.1 hypothetical protein EMELA_v1c04140 [Mesoplasma melaleucae]
MSNVIHFGAGNIGRWFIAPILLKNKQIKEVKFLDVNKKSWLKKSWLKSWFFK